MSKSPMAADLGRDLQQQIGELLERKAAIAAEVLAPHELSIMLIEAATSMNLTIAATVAGMVPDANVAGDVFDVILQAVAAGAAGDRARALAALAARRREAA